MPKILLADDEQAILHSTRMLLQQLGHEVEVAANVEDILPKMRDQRPALLLQDVRMPGLDLHALVKRIRADEACAHVRILLFSASLNLREVAEAVHADGMLEKPFRPNELRDEVARHLAASPAA